MNAINYRRPSLERLEDRPVMRRQSLWNVLCTKLGLVGKKGRTVRNGNYGRHHGFEQCEDRRMLADFTVNSMLDNGDGANTTLREAVDAANASLATMDTIKFDPTVFASGGTILLTQGQLSITESNQLIIDGRNSAGVPLGITIDGGGGTNGIVGNGDGHSIFHKSFFSAGSPDIEINGLRLTGGDAQSSGGALYIPYVNLTLKNCTITGNAAVSAGGAIYAEYGALTIENSEISQNKSSLGGGIYAESCDVVIEHSEILDNDGLVGGGIHITDGDLSIVENSTISGNDSLVEGGGIYFSDFGGDDALSITDSTISGNTAGAAGGGLFFDGRNLTLQSSMIGGNYAGEDFGEFGDGGGMSAHVANGTLTISQSAIEGNTSFGNYSGGVNIRSDNSTVTITGTTISNNKAVSYEANVGGIAIEAENGSNVTIDGVTITGNHADDDVGGLLIISRDSIVDVKYTTISNNTAHQNAPLSRDAAGGVWIQALDGAQTTIESSTISGNRIYTPPGGTKFNAYGGGIFIQGASGTTTTLRNSTISGNEAEGDGGGIKIAEHYAAPQGGQVFISHCTITNNRANTDNDGIGTGGGISIGNSTTTVTLNHTIVAGNFRGPSTGSTRDDIIGAVTASWSLIGDNTGATITGSNNQVGTSGAPKDPFLLPLADNGGPTMTHALQAFSPARNMGNPSITGAPSFDQRGTGFARIVGSRIDIGAYEAQTVMACVSTTTDELDSDLSYGDFSLREAVNYANTASEATTICLPAGVYGLTITGTGGVSQGDLDITGNMTIVGDGPGLSIINASGLVFPNNDRIFDITSNKTLNVSGVTLTLGYAPVVSGQRNGGAVRVQNLGVLNLSFSAIVGNSTGDFGDGGAIYFDSTASGSIVDSVITFNGADDQTGGVYLAASAPGAGGTVTVTRSIIAKNFDGSGFGPDVYADSNRTFTSGGKNRLGNATTGLTNGVLGNYIGTPNYIVTSVADTYDGSSDPVNMSLRDAIDLANMTAGHQEIWLPAWNFVLTRERSGQSSDMSAAYGDLDIGIKLGQTVSDGSLTIRGVDGFTTVGWRAGAIADKVFELLGDYNGDNEVGTADYITWYYANQTDDPVADGDDDGDVDNDDLTVRNNNYENWLWMPGVTVI